jgi:hypothetical protein
MDEFSVEFSVDFSVDSVRRLGNTRTRLHLKFLLVTGAYFAPAGAAAAVGAAAAFTFFVVPSSSGPGGLPT